MPQDYAVQYLAPAGSVGNQTTAAQRIEPDAEQIAVLFVVEAIGATPTVTWKVQVSVDGVNWEDAPYVDNASDTVAVAAITTAVVGAKTIYLHEGLDRHFRFARLVVSANTNVTYRAELRQNDAE
jgi:hypothetical protein